MSKPTLVSSPVQFKIAAADFLKISDGEISELLEQVYVEGGFTTPGEAALLFEASAVRSRGDLICAREIGRSNLAGMVIVVPPGSPARRLAGSNEAELHLLGVKLEYRRHGLGRMLVEAAIERANHLGYAKIILWTQPSMTAAQKLYESAGFRHTGNLERSGRDFRLYERLLTPT